MRGATKITTGNMVIQANDQEVIQRSRNSIPQPVNWNVATAVAIDVVIAA